MKRFKIVAVTVGWAVTVAIGMTATSWASSGGDSPAPAGNFAAAAAAAVPHAGPRGLGLTPSRLEGVYDPITPCRIVDTLLGGGSLPSGSSRAFYVGGTANFVPQGGKSGGCGIPVGALSITANITAVDPGGHGYLRAYPNGSSEPNATILSYAAVGSTGTGTTVAITQTSAQSLKFTNHGGPVDLIIDVTGYYAQQIEGMMTPAGGVYSGSSRILSGTHDGAGSYTITLDTDVSYCTPTATGWSGSRYVYASANVLDGTHVHVYVWTLDPTSHAVVPDDTFFFFNVLC